MQIDSEQFGSRWLTVSQAAQYLRCSKNFLDRNRISKVHRIPFARLGRVIRYDIHDLDAYLEGTKN